MCQNINAIGATLIISLMPPLMPFTSGTEVMAAQAKSHQKLAVESETWQEFISESGGFSVLLPGKPTETIVPAKPQDNSGEERQFSLETEDENLVYYISYTDFLNLSSQLNLSEIDEMFNSARDAFVEGGRLISESNLTLNEYQGRQLEREDSNGVRIKARMYWVYPRFYLLMVVTSTTTFSPASDRFLNSFKLLKTTSLKSYPSLQEVQKNTDPKDKALRLYQEGAIIILGMVGAGSPTIIAIQPTI